MAHPQGNQDTESKPPGGLPTDAEVVAMHEELARMFGTDPRDHVVVSVGHLSGNPDPVALARARKLGMRVLVVRRVDVAPVRRVSGCRPVERSAPRPRERGRGRSRVTRAGPSEDPDPDPPASPFQAALRAALYLTAGELDALVSHARIRIKVLRRWAA